MTLPPSGFSGKGRESQPIQINLNTPEASQAESPSPTDPLGRAIVDYTTFSYSLYNKITSGANDTSMPPQNDFIYSSILLISGATLLAKEANQKRITEIAKNGILQSIVPGLLRSVEHTHSIKLSGISFDDMFERKFLDPEGNVDHKKVVPYFHFFMDVAIANEDDTVANKTEKENANLTNDLPWKEKLNNANSIFNSLINLNTDSELGIEKINIKGNLAAHNSRKKAVELIETFGMLRKTFVDTLLNPSGPIFADLAQAYLERISSLSGEAAARAITLLPGLDSEEVLNFYRKIATLSQGSEGHEVYGACLYQIRRVIKERSTIRPQAELISGEDIEEVFNDEPLIKKSDEEILSRKNSEAASLISYAQYDVPTETIIGTGIKDAEQISFTIDNERKSNFLLIRLRNSNLVLQIELSTDESNPSFFNWNILDNPEAFPLERSKAIDATHRVIDMILDDPDKLGKLKNRNATTQTDSKAPSLTGRKGVIRKIKPDIKSTTPPVLARRSYAYTSVAQEAREVFPKDERAAIRESVIRFNNGEGQLDQFDIPDAQPGRFYSTRVEDKKIVFRRDKVDGLEVVAYGSASEIPNQLAKTVKGGN